jgi:hypothetical protein
VPARDPELFLPSKPSARNIFWRRKFPRKRHWNQCTAFTGFDRTYTCLSPGMPRIMNIFEPMEIVITPDTTHILT